MAPEQVAQCELADIRADIYGLGATLFQLITGTVPLAGGTLLQTYIKRMQGDPPPLSNTGSQYSPRARCGRCRKCSNGPRRIAIKHPDEVAADSGRDPRRRSDRLDPMRGAAVCQSRPFLAAEQEAK